MYIGGLWLEQLQELEVKCIYKRRKPKKAWIETIIHYFKALNLTNKITLNKRKWKIHVTESNLL